MRTTLALAALTAALSHTPSPASAAPAGYRSSAGTALALREAPPEFAPPGAAQTLHRRLLGKLLEGAAEMFVPGAAPLKAGELLYEGFKHRHDISGVVGGAIGQFASKFKKHKAPARTTSGASRKNEYMEGELPERGRGGVRAPPARGRGDDRDGDKGLDELE